MSHTASTPDSPRHALIVGGSDGIGLALARRLLAAGWRVTVASRSAAPVEHPDFVGAVLDVASAGYGDGLRALIADRGDPSLCVYCVGVGETFAARGVTHDARTLQVNLVGAALTVEAVVPAMIAAGGGHFVGLSSLADAAPSPEAPSYAASKAGLSAYLLGLGLALRSQGVHVTNVRFGFVDTKMAKSPTKPFMISADTAADVVLRALVRRPLQVTHPKRMAALMALLALWRWLQVRAARAPRPPHSR